MSRNSAGVVALISLFVFCMSAAAAAALDAAGLRDADSIFAEFDFDADDRDAVRRGEIVAVHVSPSADNELAGAVSMRLPLSIAEMAKRLRGGLIILADTHLSAHGEITDSADDAAAWDAIAFAGDDRAEVERLFNVEPGETFNLSAGEIARIRQRLRGMQGEDRDAGRLASAAMREILIDRYRAYRNRGPDGLDGYARGEEAASPARELRRMDAAEYLPGAVARLARALDDPPPSLPPDMNSRFYWKKTVVDGRPTFILSHVLVEEHADAVLFALREYYVGHSYNVLQQLGIILPDGDQSLILAVNRTITDRIGGPLGLIARPIGRHQALSALRTYFSSIRTICSRPAP